MNENTQDIDLNNDVVNEVEELDNTNDYLTELEELRAYKAEQEQARQRALQNKEAAKRRLAQKQPQSIKTNLTQDISKDLEEVKFALKVENFVRQTGFTRDQIETVLKKIPNATVDLLLDEELGIGKNFTEKLRSESFKANTPGSSRPATVNGKSFKEMTREERVANFNKIVQK